MAESEVNDEQKAIYGRVQDRGGAPGDGPGHRVADVAERLGVTTHSLYAWLKKFGPNQAKEEKLDEAQSEVRRLKAELKRVTEEHDILKKAATYFAKTSG